jgi:hypothetical protein
MTSPDSAQENTSKENDGKKVNNHDKTIELIKVVGSVIGVIGTIVVAYIGYLAVVTPIREQMWATQTAEAMSMIAIPTSTPVVTTRSPTATVQSSTLIPQPTPTPTPVTPISTPIPQTRIIVTSPVLPEKSFECIKGEVLDITLFGEIITLEIEDVDPNNILWKSVASGFIEGDNSGLDEVTGKRAIYKRPDAKGLDSIQIKNNNDLICEIILHFDN